MTEFIAQNDELAEYVERLESAADEGGQERLLEGPMPSGDSIAAVGPASLTRSEPGSVSHWVLQPGVRHGLRNVTFCSRSREPSGT